MRTNLYLDIDGVLNAATAKLTLSKAWPDFTCMTPYTLTSPSMVEQLNATIRHHNIDVFWCTTWEREAAAFGKRIGLVGAEDWPWLPTADRDGKWGKFVSVREHRNATNPDAAIWIDDDLADEHEASLWAARHGVLALAPTLAHGITPAMLTLIARHVVAAA